jgi:hypothetical protein
MAQKMTLVSILEQKMDELARKYVGTHNQKIIDELCELAPRVDGDGEVRKVVKGSRSGPSRTQVPRSRIGHWL